MKLCWGWLLQWIRPRCTYPDIPNISKPDFFLIIESSMGVMVSDSNLFPNKVTDDDKIGIELKPI